MFIVKVLGRIIKLVLWGAMAFLIIIFPVLVKCLSTLCDHRRSHRVNQQQQKEKRNECF